MGFSIIWLIFCIFFVVAVCRKKKNMKDSKAYTAKSNVQRPKKNASYPKGYVFESYPKHEGGVKKSSKGSLALKDDRNGDWLAKQLREERSSYYAMSAMFGLKTNHAANCDAYEIKREHYENCDADRVDTASVQ